MRGRGGKAAPGGRAGPAVSWRSEGRDLLAAAFLYIAIYLMIFKRLVGFGARVKKRSMMAAGPVPVGGRAAELRRSITRRTLRDSKIR